MKHMSRMLALIILVPGCRTPGHEGPGPGSPRIELLEPEGPDRVLADDTFKLRFKIRSNGFNDDPCEVFVYLSPLAGAQDRAIDHASLQQLIRGRSPDFVHKTRLKADTQNEEFAFSFRSAGTYRVILNLNHGKGESNAPGRWLAHRVTVGDGRIRVLLVEHPPRYEYRFLKSALLRDKNVLCHCLLTSSDEGFPQEHTKGGGDPAFDEPIKEFPRTLNELLRYDVILLGDVDPGKLGDDKALENLEAFVSDHGRGLIFISGMGSSPRAYKGKPPLERLLPILIDDSDTFEDEKIFDKTYGYRLTEAGRKHPITLYKQFATQEKNAEHWEPGEKGEGQTGLRWFVRAGGVKSAATTLVEATDGQDKTKRFPLFITLTYGAGRVFWSATDETWLWRYLYGDSPWFYPFWRQALRWAAGTRILDEKR